MNETSEAHNPVIEEVANETVSSTVAVAGHPLHAMSVHFPIAFVMGVLGCDLLYWWSADPFWLRAGLWSAGLGFVSGLAAGLIGTAELLLVPGIRIRAASWTHAVAAMMLLSVAGLNWGIRFSEAAPVLPHGLMLSLLSAVFVGLAGWHGGKLVFDHGIGLMISDKD